MTECNPLQIRIIISAHSHKIMFMRHTHRALDHILFYENDSFVAQSVIYLLEITFKQIDVYISHYYFYKQQQRTKDNLVCLLKEIS